MKRYFSNGNKITIEIDSKSPKSKVQSPKSAGLITPRRFRDYSPRRRKPVGINFYDLGKLASAGSIYRYYLPSLTDGTGSNIQFNRGAITQTDLDDLQSEINSDVFSHELGEFSKLAPLSNESRYVYVVYDEGAGEQFESLFDSAKFSGQGLKLNALDTIKIYGGEPLFFPFVEPVLLSNPPAGVKITATNNPAAASAAFVPSARMDVFLMPALVSNHSSVFFYNGLHDIGGHSDLVYEGEHLNHLVSTFPREKLADFVLASAETDNYQYNYKMIEIFRSFTGGRMRRAVRDFYETSPYSYYVVYSDGSPANFPFPTIYTPAGYNNATFVYDQSGIQMNFGAETAGTRLLFIISQAGNLFYFWQV